MKIKIIKDAVYCVGSGVSIHYRVREEPYSVTKAIGQTLIERGDAEAVTPIRPPKKPKET